MSHINKSKAIFCLKLILVVGFVFILLFIVVNIDSRMVQSGKALVMGKRTVNDVVDALDGRVSYLFPDIESITDGRPIAILAVKDQQILELWKQGESGSWRFIKEYPFTGMSGNSGPKLRRGDRQIPEGIYRIKSLNPNSSYHLSMELNYPNEFDLEMAELEGRHDPGDDIFIHGSNVTVGCIPIGDEAIEEVFYIIACNGYENTRVIIAPYDFREREIMPDNDVAWVYDLYLTVKDELTSFKRE